MKNSNDKIQSVLASKNSASLLSEILNQLMQEQDVDGMSLSKITGVPVTTINRLRKGDPANNPTLTTLAPLAEYFDITVSQLIGETPKTSDGSTYETSLPLLTLKQSAFWLSERETLELKKLRRVSTNLKVSDKAFAITMEGDSMLPQFPEGTLLIIEPTLTLMNRDFVIVLPLGQHTAQFKQVLIDGPDYYIKSLNPDFKEMKKIKPGIDHMIIGVLTQARMDFRQYDEQHSLSENNNMATSEA